MVRGSAFLVFMVLFISAFFVMIYFGIVVYAIHVSVGGEDVVFSPIHFLGYNIVVPKSVIGNLEPSLSCTGPYACDDPEVTELAHTLGCDINAMYHVVKSVPYVPSAVQHYPNETLAKGGDCDDKAFLLASLLRACGIPAYAVYGYAITGDHSVLATDNVTFVLDGGAPHSWVQVMADGEWVPLDPVLSGSPLIAVGYYGNDYELIRKAPQPVSVVVTVNYPVSTLLTLLTALIPAVIGGLITNAGLTIVGRLRKGDKH